MIIILFVPIILLFWILNLVLSWPLENRGKILNNNFKIFIGIIITITIYEMNTSDLSSQFLGFLFFFLHPIILFIYILVERGKLRKVKNSEDILDDDF